MAQPRRSYSEDDADELQAWEEEADQMFTKERLQQLSGFDDLDLVNGTELVVDTNRQSLAVVGELLPALEQFRLSHSIIPSLRDMGSKFVRLKILWLNNCQVEDCSGLQHCHQLQELYISFNRIKTLSPLGGLMNLSILDAEANLLESEEDISVLASLSELTEVTLTGNPICFKYPSDVDYRKAVLALCPPSLVTLDEKPVEAQGKATGGATANDDDGGLDAMDEALQEELRALNECVKTTHGIGVERLVEEQHRSLYSRGSTSSAGVRPNLSRTGAKGSEAPHPSSAPTMGSPEKQRGPNKVHASSDLTHVHSASSLTTSASGTFSGSAIRNLRKKKESSNAPGQSSLSRPPLPPGGGSRSSTPTTPIEQLLGDSESDSSPHMKELMELDPNVGESGPLAFISPEKQKKTDDQQTAAAPSACSGDSLFEQYKKKFGYASGDGSEGTPAPNATTSKALSTSDIVGAVRSQKRKDGEVVERTMLTEAVYGRPAGEIQKDTGVADASMDASNNREEPNFESLDLNDFSAMDDGDVL